MPSRQEASPPSTGNIREQKKFGWNNQYRITAAWNWRDVGLQRKHNIHTRLDQHRITAVAIEVTDVGLLRSPASAYNGQVCVSDFLIIFKEMREKRLRERFDGFSTPPSQSHGG